MTRHNGAAIRAFREALGMTLRDLADKLEIGPLELGDIEDEGCEMSPYLIGRTAAMLSVGIDALTRTPITNWDDPEEPEEPPAPSPAREGSGGAGQDLAGVLAELLTEVRAIRKHLQPPDAIDDPDVPDEEPGPVPTYMTVRLPFGDGEAVTWWVGLSGEAYADLLRGGTNCTPAEHVPADAPRPPAWFFAEAERMRKAAEADQ